MIAYFGADDNRVIWLLDLPLTNERYRPGKLWFLPVNGPRPGKSVLHVRPSPDFPISAVRSCTTRVSSLCGQQKSEVRREAVHLQEQICRGEDLVVPLVKESRCSFSIRTDSPDEVLVIPLIKESRCSFSIRTDSPDEIIIF